MKSRKKFTASTKSSILKQHLREKKAISELCESFGCSPSNVYQWQDTLFSKAHVIFEESSKKVGRPKDKDLNAKKMDELEEKLATKNAIISELMEELLKEKKLAGVI